MTPDQIKTGYIANEHKFFALRGEIYNICRLLKMWQTISTASIKFDGMVYENYFGWIQSSGVTLRIIAIDSIKLHDDTLKYTRNILGKFLSASQIKDLIKHSNLSYGIKRLGSIASHLREWRNKKFAHYEDVDVQVVSTDLHDLMVSMSNISQSIDFIMHYLINPHYIVNSQWDMFKTCKIDETNLEQSSINIYFERDAGDPTMIDFRDMLNALNKSKI